MPGPADWSGSCGYFETYHQPTGTAHVPPADTNARTAGPTRREPSNRSPGTSFPATATAPLHRHKGPDRLAPPAAPFEWCARSGNPPCPVPKHASPGPSPQPANRGYRSHATDTGPGFRSSCPPVRDLFPEFACIGDVVDETPENTAVAGSAPTRQWRRWHHLTSVWQRLCDARIHGQAQIEIPRRHPTETAMAQPKPIPRHPEPAMSRNQEDRSGQNDR